MQNTSNDAAKMRIVLGLFVLLVFFTYNLSAKAAATPAPTATVNQNTDIDSVRTERNASPSMDAAPATDVRKKGPPTALPATHAQNASTTTPRTSIIHRSPSKRTSSRREKRSTIRTDDAPPK